MDARYACICNTAAKKPHFDSVYAVFTAHRVARQPAVAIYNATTWIDPIVVRFYTGFACMPIPAVSRVVWVVDDSPLDAERARRALTGDCSVEVFPDGSAALERLATTSTIPDVMVLDWVMPGVSGVDVCRFLRSAQGGHLKVGILLLTTHRHTEQIVEGLSAGANDYLAKPYAHAELQARVNALLRTRQLLERAESAEALSFKLLQLAPDALIALDAARNITFINEMAQRALQLAAEPEAGTPLAQLFPELDRRLRIQPAGDSVHLSDLAIGDRLYSPTLRLLPTGKIFTTIVSLRDVTESRRLDARRLDFYSIIAHDLRTPLNTLTLRTQLILEGRHGELPQGLKDDLHKMDRNLQSLIEMINDFLELARLDNVRYELKNDDVDVSALLKETMETLRPQLTARKLHWVAESRDDASVLGDQRRLQQVLTNLLSNAIKFTDIEGTITTTVEHSGTEVEVSVRDTGHGIPAASLPTIFERYTRAADTRDKVPGTGLGLMIVREIVEAHGGRLGVESTVGVGSRFWFRLPSAPAKA
jgi:signal transduction histidine kinase